MKETELFDPVRIYLEKQGYNVQGEVLACDIAAKRDDELIVVELKTQFNLSLVFQAITRQEAADSVYVAIPVTTGKKYPANFKGICKLLKRLEVGLILVYFLKRSKRVEVVLHPVPFEKRRSHKKRRNIIREIDGRYKNFNKGGSRSKDEKITAYKQGVIQIACYLDKLGEASPAKLKQLGTISKTGDILLKNYYGWFERIRKGVYTLHAQGKKALENYPELVKHFNKMLTRL